MVMGLHTVVNYLLLLGTSRISGNQGNRLRLCFAAAWGGLFSGLSLIRGQFLPPPIVARIIEILIIGVIAFGIGKEALRRMLVFLFLNLSLDGMFQLTQRTEEIIIILCAAIISFVCRFLSISGAVRSRFSKIEIHHCGNTIKFNALRDTGNSLIDPVTGENMLVIGPRIASALTGLTKEELASPINTLHRGRVRGLWLVPFSSVGNSGGLMLAMRFPDSVLDGRHYNFVAALASEGLDDYDALIGGFYQ